MDDRVTALEGEMRDVKSTLTGIELTLARIEATLGSLATKSDLAAVNGALKLEIESVRGDFKSELATFRGEVKAEFAAVRGELKTEFAAVRAEFKTDLAGVTGSLAALTEKSAGQDIRLKSLEAAINETIKTAVGKAIGPWQLPMVTAACLAVITGFVGALNWMAHQPWFNR